MHPIEPSPQIMKEACNNPKMDFLGTYGHKWIPFEEETMVLLFGSMGHKWLPCEAEAMGLLFGSMGRKWLPYVKQ